MRLKEILRDPREEIVSFITLATSQGGWNREMTPSEDVSIIISLNDDSRHTSFNAEDAGLPKRHGFSEDSRRALNFLPKKCTIWHDEPLITQAIAALDLEKAASKLNFKRPALGKAKQEMQ